MSEIKKILIADSGATKTDWISVTYNEGDKSVESYSGVGISPLHHSESTIQNELVLVRESLGDTFDEIRFYGAGLGTERMQRKMKDILNGIFQAAEIETAGDMLGAAKALLGDKPGIACIMGTGSNSCYYDGEKITIQPISLGYMLDDEGGAVTFGRRLLADVFKKISSPEVIERFNKKYNLTEDEVIDRIYRQPAPNRWIASFAPFLTENQDLPELSEMIDSQIERFLDREFAIYPKETLRNEGIAFAGTLATVYADRLRSACERRGWKVGNITRRPILELL